MNNSLVLQEALSIPLVIDKFSQIDNNQYQEIILQAHSESPPAQKTG